MRVDLLSVALLATIVPLHANAQQDSRAQLRLYNQQAGLSERAGRDWRDYRHYDYDRPESGQRVYNANRYYRDSRYYQATILTRNDRIYRGSDHQYYCRRTDGTTGLISGIAGHMRGDILPLSGSNSLDIVIGTRSGAPLGVVVDKGKLVCR